MKYERQPHSPLFIALQERQEEEKKLAAPQTLQGRGGIAFLFAKEGKKKESPPVLRMHTCHCNGHRQAGLKQGCACHLTSERWLNKPLHPLFFSSSQD